MTSSGIIILRVSVGHQSQKMAGNFPSTRHLGGDFDHGKIMEPDFVGWSTSAETLQGKAARCDRGSTPLERMADQKSG